MSKELKDKAVNIQGKSYVLVSDRVVYFNDSYPNGKIETKLVRYQEKQIIIKAIVTPDVEQPQRYFTGYSQEIEGQGYINKTSALENGETSAVGRALALMGIGVIDSIASVDEINKAKTREFNTSVPGQAAESGEVPFGDNHDKCVKCGADLKMKKDGSGKYCSALCWKK